MNAPAPIQNSDLSNPRRFDLGMSAEIGKLAEAVCAVMGKLKPIEKTQPTGKGINYEYLSEDTITGTLRPLLAEAGLVILPRSCEVIEREDYLAKSGGEMTRFLTRHTWRILHKSGQWVDGQTWGEASDSGDKCLNKTMTAAYKYFERQTFAINGGHDPDATGPDEVARGERGRGYGGDPRGGRQSNQQQARGNGQQNAGNRAAGGNGQQNQGQNAGSQLKPATDADAGKAVAALDKAADHAAVAKIIDYAKGFAWTDAQKQRIRGAAAARRVAFWTAAIDAAPDEATVGAIQSEIGGALQNFPELAQAVRVRAKNRCDYLFQQSDIPDGTPNAGTGSDNADMPFGGEPVSEMEF